MNAKFLQLHTLTSYPASLLNRDDVGFAKRIPFGGSERVRVSSQCLKRHWRTADHDLALDRIPLEGGSVPMAVRSRRTFEKHVFRPLVEGGVDEAVAATVTEKIMESLLPKGKARAAQSEEEEEATFRTAQVTVLGRPETRYLLDLARTVAAEAENPKEVEKAWKEIRDRDLKKNLDALRLGAGLDAALFGRMVTGDILARCDAAIHVAHAFTVDAGAFETDYFSAVDDLQPEAETGSGHINTSELTTGLFYGYVVVDVPLLVSNLEGCERREWRSADRELSAEVVRRFIHLVTTVSPGAKLGATAPYARALSVLAEVGNDQPRTLANAFLDAVRAKEGLVGTAQGRWATHLRSLDEMYGRDTQRRLAAVEAPPELLDVVDERSSLPELATWAARAVEEAA